MSRYLEWIEGDGMLAVRSPSGKDSREPHSLPSAVTSPSTTPGSRVSPTLEHVDSVRGDRGPSYALTPVRSSGSLLCERASEATPWAIDTTSRMTKVMMLIAVP
jgi:hypothetical protein